MFINIGRHYMSLYRNQTKQRRDTEEENGNT